MAFITGTATDHVDLWNTLLDFLQNNPELTAAGQNWTVAWSHPTDPELVLKGPGLAGEDEVLVGLRRRDGELTAGESVIDISGMTGVISNAPSWSDHVGVLPQRPLVFLDQNPMQYWIVASGRRFIMVLRISTVYQALYAGLFLPYSTPSAYPYPLFIGGTRGMSGHASAVPASWRATEMNGYRHFVYPRSSASASSLADSQALMLDPSGTWLAGTYSFNETVEALGRFVMGNRGFPSYLGRERPNAVSGPGGSNPMSDGNPLGYNSILSRVSPGLNGELPLTPITLMYFLETPAPSPVTYGILDGVFAVPGAGNAAENIVTFNGVDHLVVQNVQRTDHSEYWALALE